MMQQSFVFQIVSHMDTKVLDEQVLPISRPCAICHLQYDIGFGKICCLGAFWFDHVFEDPCKGNMAEGRSGMLEF